YQHDLVIWLVPLTAALAAAKANPAVWRTRTAIALAWPAWAILAELAEQSGGWPSHLPLDLRLIPLAGCLAWVAAAAKHSPAAADRVSIGRER
ncbi:MAG: hypothetical protein ACJ8F1_14890, partial [Polyangia bacterium]